MSHAFEGRGVFHQGDGFLETHHMRVAARKAMVQLDENDKVRKALDHRMRPGKNHLKLDNWFTFGERKIKHMVFGKGLQESLDSTMAQRFGSVMETKFYVVRQSN